VEEETREFQDAHSTRGLFLLNLRILWN